MKRILLILLLFTSAAVQATPAGVFRADARAPMDKTYPAIYKAVEAARFWVVFEADIGNNLAGFAKKWGDDYNRNQLSGIRSMVVCNGWYANAVSNADPDLLALCPLRVNLVEKDGATRVLFARPSVIAAGSPGEATVREIEDILVQAIRAGVEQAEQP
jgi:uncharacterized protein (DUF302 family)